MKVKYETMITVRLSNIEWDRFKFAFERIGFNDTKTFHTYSLSRLKVVVAKLKEQMGEVLEQYDGCIFPRTIQARDKLIMKLIEEYDSSKDLLESIISLSVNIDAPITIFNIVWE